mmetsp:Transcript_19739/g.49111  ORF Transcript_19739/g.49111 Transcript_19739/m.49111 type:complete len:121 (+) Transcript_19739:789-1151(+)
MRLFYNFPPRLPMLFFRDTIFSALLYFFTVPFSAMTPRDAHYAAITPPPAAVSPVLGESHFYTRVFYAARTGRCGNAGAPAATSAAVAAALALVHRGVVFTAFGDVRSVSVELARCGGRC